MKNLLLQLKKNNKNISDSPTMVISHSDKQAKPCLLLRKVKAIRPDAASR